MEVVNATSEDGFGVLKSLSDSETEKFTDKFISDLKALISVETDNSIDEEERKEAIEEININLGVMFEYERERDIFIRKLKDGFSDWMQRFSTYYWDGCKFISGNLSSPEILFGIRKLLENNKSDFANAIREAGIELAQEELKASKSDEVNAYIGDNKESKLQNEINQLLLQNDIAQMQIEIRKMNLFDQSHQLIIQRKSEKIKTLEYSKQQKLIDLKIEGCILEQEARNYFTEYHIYAKRIQLGDIEVHLGRKLAAENRHDYKLRSLEKEQIEVQEIYLSGGCSIQDYQEDIREIDKKIEIENNRHANFMQTFFPQEQPIYDDQTASKGERHR